MGDNYGHYNQNYQHGSVASTKVYINPNFNRNVLENKHISSSTVMYLNPNFTHVAPTSALHKKTFDRHEASTRQKIHVNPNFFQPNTHNYGSISSFQSLAVDSLPNAAAPDLSSTHSSTIQAVANNKTNKQVTVSKSRYCLVRQKENKEVNSPVSKASTSTVRVNKYKLVSLSSVKKDLIVEKTASSKSSVIPTNQYQFHSQSRFRTSKSVPNRNPNKSFSLVKLNTMTTLNLTQTKHNGTRRVSITPNETIVKTKKKIVKGALKKNNIPCPLFKKYGKCLRKSNGHCEFLHDKKHVSICRKFLKGVCHNNKCLLSHDLTDKKMPTCFFYLQGNCTKEGCPYLHVKLNDKIKICQEFLKGYCEKGDKCLYRHVNVVAAASSSSRKPGLCLQRNTITHSENKSSDKIFVKNKKVINKVKTDTNEDNCNNEKEHRYFTTPEEANSEEQCGNIKPTRCKLGTLPSFIQL